MSATDPPSVDRLQRRRRLGPIVLIAGTLGTLLLSLSITGTLSAFTAAITNSVNTAASGRLIMQEKSGATTCNSDDATPPANNVNTNAATCATINKYGGSTTMTPGVAVTTNITIGNTGTVPASTFSLIPGGCTQSANGSPSGSATDLCAQLTVLVKSGATTVVSATASALASGGAIVMPPALIPAVGGTTAFTVTVTLAAGVGNTYQGKAATQPLMWAFST